MARSTLFALLVLVLIQVALALPFGRSVIINKAAHGALKGNINDVLTVSRDYIPFKPWTIIPYDEGISISVKERGQSFYINAVNEGAFLSTTKQKWYLENAGQNSYKIKLPNEDQVLGWDENSEEVHLQEADGSDEQLWSIDLVERAYDYGRVYRQC